MGLLPFNKTTRVNRGAYLGTAAGASIPSAAGKTPGDYYIITTAGGAYSIGDIAVVQVGSAGYDRISISSGLAAINGSNITSVATWRTALDVPSNADARRMASSDRMSGLSFFGVASTKMQATTRQTIGTGPVSMWVRFRVPTTLSTTRGIAALGPDASYVLGSGGNSIGLAVWGASSDVVLVMGDGTNYTRYPLGVAAQAGRIIDVVVTRTGSTLAGYVNGDAVTLTGTNTGTGCAASASITATYGSLALATLAAATGTFDSNIHRFAIFNRALSASEVPNLLAYSVDPADQWGSTTDIINASTLNGGFETAGTGGGDVFGSWTESPVSGGSFTRDTTDFDSGAAACRIINGASSGSNLYQNIGLLQGKRYRVAWRGKAAVGSPSIWMRLGGAGSSTATNTKAMTGSWASYEFEDVNSSTSAASYFYVQSTVASTEALVDGVTLTRIGAFLDWDFTIGVGLQIPDRSTNTITADGSGQVEHIAPRRWGTFTVEKVLAHSDVSSSAATTKLLDLPPFCAITGVEFHRTTAFDGGITVSVGTSGSATKFVNAQSVASTGIVRVASGDLASQSSSASTPIYIQKSGSTTVGAMTVCVTVEIRG